MKDFDIIMLMNLCKIQATMKCHEWEKISINLKSLDLHFMEHKLLLSHEHTLHVNNGGTGECLKRRVAKDFQVGITNDTLKLFPNELPWNATWQTNEVYYLFDTWSCTCLEDTIPNGTEWDPRIEGADLGVVGQRNL